MNLNTILAPAIAATVATVSPSLIDRGAGYVGLLSRIPANAYPIAKAAALFGAGYLAHKRGGVPTKALGAGLQIAALTPFLAPLLSRFNLN